MKLKVKATGETLEVAPDSYVCGLRPNGNEVEFLAEEVEIIPNDWAAFRMEAAKDILAGFAGSVMRDDDILEDKTVKDLVKTAVMWTDELIKQIKEEQK